jgi:hypothetical protein
MLASWKIKRFLGLKFDLLDAYGEVLERHCSHLEPIEVLPAEKKAIKEAILLEAFSAKAIKNPDCSSALMVSFLSLANFQKGIPKGSPSLNTKTLKDLSNLPGDQLVDAIYELGPSIKASSYMSTYVDEERNQLAEQWQSEFERFANAYESYVGGKGREHAHR